MSLSNRTHPATGVTEADQRRVEHALLQARTYIQLTPRQSLAEYRYTLNEINTALQSLEISEYPQLPAPAAA